MASVFLIFGYMAATTFLLGFGAVTLLRRLAGEAETPAGAKRQTDTSHQSSLPENRQPDGRQNSAAAQANNLPPAFDVPACCMAGLVCVTVYAQLWSLFGGVGLAANLVLLTLCAAVLLAQQQALRRYVKERLTGSSCHATAAGSGHAAVDSDYAAANSGHASVTAFHDALPPRRLSAKSVFFRLLPALLLSLLFAYGASRGYMHYDSDLYHAQAIRWIEEYGVVPGLANLHTRLGYNSASFALSALYSFAFLGGRSYHACAGFLALLTAAESLKILGVFRGRAIVLADFARLATLYYLFAVFDELVSPASDYFMVLCAFYLVIRFLALAERRENSYFPYALLAMLAVYTVTVKLSAAGLLLLAAAPVVMVLRRRRLRPFLVFLGTALLIAAPFLIRNVILTGWLVYPMTALNLFHFDWQVPVGVAAADAREIAVWGRGYSDVSRYGEPLVYWISGWFHRQATANKLFLLAALAALPVMLGWVVWEKNRLRRAAQTATAADAKQCHTAPASAAPNAMQASTAARSTMPATPTALASDYRRFLLIALALAAVVCALAFWFLNAPLMRYGCVFVYLTAFLGAGLVFTGGGAQEKLERRCCLVVCALFLAAKCFSGVMEQLPNLSRPYWIFQQDYGKYEAVVYDIGGQTFYYAANGDRLGYNAFPSSPARAKIRLRGEGLREGFAYDDGTGPTGVDNTGAQSGAAGDGNTARADNATTGSSWQADEATTGNPWWIGNATTGNSWQADAATTGSSWQTDSAATGSNWQADEATTGSSWQADNATTGSSYRTDSATTGSSWQADAASPSALSPDAQLDAIARNMAAQCFEENLLASPFPYCYAVTDLDQNGSPELLTSISLGTSHTAVTKIWAVEADGSLTRRMYSPAVPEDGDVQLVDSSLPVYRDSESGTLQYITESVVKTGLHRTVDRITALSFKDGILNESLLGERDAYPASSEETAEITADYYGFVGGKHAISEEEFGRLADDAYGAANRQTAHFLWEKMNEDDPLLYDEALRRQAVRESFAGFYID